MTGPGTVIGGRVAIDARYALSLALSLGLSAIILWYFHDRFWWPVDEGVYAYVAQRMLAGDVLHRDLIDLHAGYVNIVHALAFKLFGEDLLSLRYPLVLLTLAQAAFAWRLLAPAGPWPAFVAATVATAFSFIQFLNPSANWYALFFFFVTCWALTRTDPSRRRDVILIGFLIGLCFLFRQLSGVFLAMGAVFWLVMKLKPATEAPPRLARAVLAIILLGLAFYLWSKGSLFALLVFGIWPLGMLAAGMTRVRADDGPVLKLVAALAAGALLAALPLVLYHLFEGSLLAWLDDIFLTAMLIHQQEFIARSSFAHLLLGGVVGLTQWNEPALMLNGILWISLLAAAPLLGVLALRDLLRRDRARAIHPLPALAVFFVLVAIHFQIAIYLFLGIVPVLVALLWRLRDWRSGIVTVALVGLSAIAVYYQAGQPVSRNLAGLIRGDRVLLDAPEGLPRASLVMQRSDQRVFEALIGRIESGARPGELLFTLPMDPELNFITGRPSPAPYYGTPLGLRSRADVTETLARLERAAPLFVVHRRDDKYMTPLSDELLQAIRRLDSSPEIFGPFDLYRLPASAAMTSKQPPRE